MQETGLIIIHKIRILFFLDSRFHQNRSYNFKQRQRKEIVESPKIRSKFNPVLLRNVPKLQCCIHRCLRGVKSAFVRHCRQQFWIDMNAPQRAQWCRTLILQSGCPTALSTVSVSFVFCRVFLYRLYMANQFCR